MHLEISNEEVDQGLKVIENFIAQSSKSYLNENEKAILRGALKDWTYKQMSEQFIVLKFYTIEYISRNLAYKLWNRLSDIAQKASGFDSEYRVSKKKIWNFVNHINQLQSPENTWGIVIPPVEMETQTLHDRYEIEEYLFDRDGGERHFRAIDRYLGNKSCIVIQRFHQTLRIKQQFERESKLLLYIGKHSQIPELLAYFSSGESLYLVYEQMSGNSLIDMLTAQPWQEAEVISLLRNLLTVLVFIQEKNIIHRNLNPDNIILSNDTWAITDFSMVKEIQDGANSTSHSTFAQGSKGYLPAEQLMGMATFASDVYAVGMIAIHAITGIHPRKLKIDTKTGNTVWRNQTKVNNRLADIIDRAISYHFCDRYQTAQAMLENLKII